MSVCVCVCVYVCSRSMEQRVRACDDAFREQLEAKEAAHQAHFSRLEAQKLKDVEIAERKVSSVL